MHNTTLLKIIKNTLGGAIGNSIEWYDFAIFGFLAPVISKVLVSANNLNTALIYTYALFAIGFISRPLGSIIFGYIGDRYGRTTTLRITIWLMSIPTVLIGFMPSYASLGVAVPMMIAVLRLLQGLAMGGEFTGSIIYLTESAPQRRHNLFGSFGYISTTVGILAGSAIVTLLHHLFSNKEVFEYAWRIPFIFSIVLTFIAYWLRKNLPEPESSIKKDKPTNPIKIAFKEHSSAMLYSILLNFFNAIGFYTFFIFTVTYLQVYLHIAVTEAHIINTICLAVLIIMMPISGILSDRFTRKRVLLTSAFFLLITIYPIFSFLSSTNIGLTLALLLIASVLFGLVQGSLPAAFVSLFPASVRASGLSISFNISNALFGGTAPMIAVWLIHLTHSFHALVYYLLTALIVFIITVLKLPRTQ